jgi:hypothetical protein
VAMPLARTMASESLVRRVVHGLSTRRPELLTPSQGGFWNVMAGPSQSGASSTSIVPPQVKHRPGRAGALKPSLERPQATQ